MDSIEVLVTITTAVIFAFFFLLVYRLKPQKLKPEIQLNASVSARYFDVDLPYTHKERVERIVLSEDQYRVGNILAHPACTASMKRRIEGFYNPHTQMYFMRYSELFDFEFELNAIIRHYYQNKID